MTTKPELIDRISQYLAAGGFFNPEHMEHDKVRELLIDCREALQREPDHHHNALACPYCIPSSDLRKALARHTNLEIIDRLSVSEAARAETILGMPVRIQDDLPRDVIGLENTVGQVVGAITNAIPPTRVSVVEATPAETPRPRCTDSSICREPCVDDDGVSYCGLCGLWEGARMRPSTRPLA